MSAGSQGIFACCKETTVFVQVVGPGVSRNSRFLREFAQQKLQEGCRWIIVDLARCEGMDSTFLGVFASLALALQDTGRLSLVDLLGESRRAFLDLGLDQMTALETTDGQKIRHQFPPAASFELLLGSDLTSPQLPADPLERALLMLECHESLCRADRRNEEKFRDVKQFLREDIARCQLDRPPTD